MSVELPFTLTHPKPEPLPEPVKEPKPVAQSAETAKKAAPAKAANGGTNDQTVPVDLNLIEFDTTNESDRKEKHEDDDLIFEEFARIRLKGHDPDDTDV